MKIVTKITILLLFLTNVLGAQEIMYIYKSDSVIAQFNTSDIDSVIFYKPEVKDVEVEDVDGNLYHTVTIGSQVWMKENLRTTKFSDGSDIPLVTGNTEWMEVGSPAYCWYDNNKDFATRHTYGALYNWYSVNTGELCPEGWRVPSDEDWKQLELFLGMSEQEQAGIGVWRGTIQGQMLKAESGWFNSGNGTDDYGFSALGGGWRHAFDNGRFDRAGEYCDFWSSTIVDELTVFTRSVYGSHNDMFRTANKKGYGFSVRCLKDQ